MITSDLCKQEIIIFNINHKIINFIKNCVLLSFKELLIDIETWFCIIFCKHVTRVHAVYRFIYNCRRTNITNWQDLQCDCERFCCKCNSIYYLIRLFNAIGDNELLNCGFSDDTQWKLKVRGLRQPWIISL